MPKRKKPPSQTWRAFLDNHILDLVSIDFLVVLGEFLLRIILKKYLSYYHRRMVKIIGLTANHCDGNYLPW